MKKVLYRILFVLLIVSGLSCDRDFLDTKIDVFETPETVTSRRSTLFSFANAYYTFLPYGHRILDGNLFAPVSDEAVQTAKHSTDALLFVQGEINSNNINIDSGMGLYKRLYEGIRSANFFLEYSENYKEILTRNRDVDNDSINLEKDVQDIQWYRAEAHIARAYFYYELIKRWGSVPFVNEVFEGGNKDIEVEQKSFEQMIEYIVDEIDFHKNDLQYHWNSSEFGDQAGRFDYGFALALKARVLLLAASPLHNITNDLEKWLRAASAAYDVISLELYTLDPDYEQYFTGSHSLQSRETIYAIRRPSDNALEQMNYPITTPGGNSGVTPSHNLVESYERISESEPDHYYGNRDPRLYSTVVLNGSEWNGRIIDQAPGGSDDMSKSNTSRTGYYLKKFLSDELNLEQNQTAQHPWVVFRYAEVLLNYAEALNEVFGPDNSFEYDMTARQALHLVRSRASERLPAVDVDSKEDFRDAVHHERKIELAFEDHRYWDLLRWKKATEHLNGSIKGMKIDKDENGNFTYEVHEIGRRNFPKRMYFFPFSYSEIVNSDGRLKQNPGY